MNTIKPAKVTLPLIHKTVFGIFIVYLCALIIIFAYIPFDIQYAAIQKDGSFTLSLPVIEYAWLIPPEESSAKMIAGVDWQRISLEMTAVTGIAALGCLFCKK